MARTNKYTSINFNHVLEKNLSSSGSAASNNGKHTKQSSSSYSSITSSPSSHLHAARAHGRMLVLTKPTPKPISLTPPLSPSPSSSPQTQQPQTQTPERRQEEPNSDQISLRPLGRTGASSENFSPVLGQERDKEVGSVVVLSPKPDKFVPPHLRPGFVGRKESPGPEVFRGRESGQRHFGSPGRYGEDGRPKSGGYERTRKGGESDPGLMYRPRSSGNRPSSSGSWGCERDVSVFVFRAVRIKSHSDKWPLWDEKSIVIALEAVLVVILYYLEIRNLTHFNLECRLHVGVVILRQIRMNHC